MNKKYIFSACIILFFSILLYSLFYNNTQKVDSVKDTLIKNLNWDSPLKSEVPYVIGNQIELYYILDYQAGNEISIDVTLLREEFNISEIKIGEKILEISDNISFNIIQNTPLKISGTAKNNSNNGEKNLRNLIKISAKNNSKTLQKNNSNPIDIIPQKAIIDDSEDLITVIPEEKKQNEPIIEIIPEKIDDKNIFSGLTFNEVNFNSNINNLLEITGKNIEKIKYLNIGSYSYTPIFKDETAYFLIKQNTFSSGNYFVFIQPITGNIIPLDVQMNFEYSKSQVNIANITPNQVNNTKNAYIVLQGNGFNDIISLQLSNNIILEKTDFEIINDKVLSVKIDKNISPGEYSFNIMTTNDIIKINNMNFTIIK